MPLPAPLLRRKKNTYKNNFGHILIISGSKNMVGATCLTGLAAMRSGSGLVTAAIPKSLNTIIHRKISPVIMTLPLSETKAQTLALSAYTQFKKSLKLFNTIAIGPGLSRNSDTQKLIIKVIKEFSLPMVIDADALTALSKNMGALHKAKGTKVLTPHPGEMARMTKLTKNFIEKNRQKVARDFAKKFNCVLLLKGHRTVVASPKGEVYINKTGNAGMATAGSGDVLTGIIAALLGQGLSGFQAAKHGAYIHGKAADLATRSIAPASLIATDIIDNISRVIRKQK